MSNKYPGGFVSLGGQIPSYSVVFDGTGDYLSVADNTALDMEASDFTMECWFKPNASASVAGQTIFGKRANSGTIGGTLLGFWGTDLKPAMYATVNGSTWGVSNVTSSVALSVGVWSHLAFTRSGSTWTIWVNGFATATATLAGTVPNNTSAFTIGATAADGSDTICASNISNVRIVKGTALYTTSFTPPTGPLKNITNTSLLTCQSATLIDNSSNGFTVTASGNAAVSSAQPPFPSYNPNNLDPALGAATPGVWTLSQALAAEVTRSWPMYDPYYKNVVLNLHGNGTNAAQNNTFLDSSTNNFTITRNGNTTQGSFSPYGSGWSNYFGAGNYLGLSGGTACAFGTGDFTIETWVYMTSTSGIQAIYEGRPAGTEGAYVLFYTNSGAVTLYVNGSNVLAAGTLTSNTWYHIALCRSGTSTKIFINGTQSGSTYSDSTNYLNGTGRPYIGIDNSANSTYSFLGYISNMRVLKGTALYTTTFTPPTSPLTAITNTSLLTCQSNRFIDNSSNAFAITVNGTPSVQRFQPFLFNTSYTPSTIGGSGYFDGTGDYLTIPWATPLTLGAGDFTIECWLYGAFSGDQRPLACGDATLNYYIYAIYLTGTELRFYAGDGTSYAIQMSAVGAMKKNAWNHVAVVRSGSTATMYVNGVSVATDASASVTLPAAGTALWIGGEPYGGGMNFFNGYITDMRINKGTAIYTGAFTPPTLAPLATSGASSAACYPSTTNVNTSFAASTTSLLTSMTNGAIYDNAMMNDLETVGNAQISTSVKKYGTGSLYFDGSGDLLIVAPSNLHSATTNFTVEFWLNLASYGGVQVVVAKGIVGDTAGSSWWFEPVAGNMILYVASGSTYYTVTASSPPTSQWVHFAGVINNGTAYLYMNGVSQGTPVSVGTPNAGPSAPLIIGNDPSLSYPINGYIDDLRITKGVARYVANFTPPTSQLQDQ